MNWLADHGGDMPFPWRRAMHAGHVGCLLLCSGLTLFGTGCRPPTEAAPVPVRVAVSRQPSSALLLIAWHQGFFEEAGLAPTFITYPSGKRALDEGLLSGMADVVSVPDSPVAKQLLAGEDLLILCTVQSIRSVNAIVARRDRGIESIQDLPGKRVGIQSASAVHYFLHRAMRAHNISPDSAVQIPYLIENLVSALHAGDVDAISIREPFLSEAISTLNTNVLVLEAPWVYAQFELFVTTPEFRDQHPEVLVSVLHALLRAEHLIKTAPAQAEAILAEVLDIDISATRRIRENTINYVFLPHSLLPSLEEQMRWFVDNGESGDPSRNVLEDLYLAPLRQLRPLRVCASSLRDEVCP